MKLIRTAILFISIFWISQESLMLYQSSSDVVVAIQMEVEERSETYEEYEPREYDFFPVNTSSLQEQTSKFHVLPYQSPYLPVPGEPPEYPTACSHFA